MNTLKVEIDSIFPFVSREEIHQLQDEISLQHSLLINRQGKGNDFLGWLDMPTRISDITHASIEFTTEQLRKKSDVVVIVGIGGSYLGAKSIIEALQDPFPDLKQNRPAIVYAGNHLSQDYMVSLLELLDTKDYSVVVISKSGTTTEPAIAFRMLKQHLQKKYGTPDYSSRVVAITDSKNGALKQMANNEGYQSFNIPDDVGGRYSVLTPVGLLPIRLAGFNIEKLLEGAQHMEALLKKSPLFENNPAALYVAARNALYRKGKPIELLVNFEPSLSFFGEWWKQLFGESEGKQHRGIFPAAVSFTTDLHSMGQYIQDGMRVIFETMISVDEANAPLQVPFDNDNMDGINFMAEKSLIEINHIAEQGTRIAHKDGGVPCIRITIPKINEYYMGQLIYFFEFSCALSGYVLDVNPFDQPGVEDYKNNMFALLGKKGYEERRKELLK